LAPVIGVPSLFFVTTTVKTTPEFSHTALLVQLTWYLQSSSSAYAFGIVTP